jgi:hypothetical protein
MALMREETHVVMLPPSQTSRWPESPESFLGLGIGILGEKPQTRESALENASQSFVGVQNLFVKYISESSEIPFHSNWESSRLDSTGKADD